MGNQPLECCAQITAFRRRSKKKIFWGPAGLSIFEEVESILRRHVMHQQRCTIVSWFQCPKFGTPQLGGFLLIFLQQPHAANAIPIALQLAKEVSNLWLVIRPSEHS